ncbi:MAG: glucose-1-phosphate adenylyltransferase [Brevinematales bacterium]|jgi:glucose-1-phosphate adenylyltransferase
MSKAAVKPQRPNVNINEVLGLILGGGKGTRLYPLTKDRSKPAVPFGGCFRLIDIPISNCINSGINRVFVMTQFNSTSLNRHITQTYKFDIFHNGFVDILATEQTQDIPTSAFTQGTADAVRRALRHFRGLRDSGDAKYVLLLSGDQLYSMDFKTLLSAHIENKAQITLGIIPVQEEDTSRFGILKIDESCKITNFIEKPKNKDDIKDWAVPKKYASVCGPGKPFFGSMGIYLFNIDTLYDILLTHPEMLDFGKEVIPYSIENKYDVYGFVHHDYWEDIGTIKSFHQANIELTMKNGPFDLFKLSNPFFSRPRFLPPSRVFNSKIDNAVISYGIMVDEVTVKNSVIGVRSIIKKGVKIENSVIIGADFYETDEAKARNAEKKIPDIGIGENTIIKNAIIDKNCRIGKNVRIVNDEGILNKEENDYAIVDGIVVIVKNSIISDDTVI